MVRDQSPLIDLADTLVDLAALDTPEFSPETRSDSGWTDPEESEYWQVWCEVCAIVRNRFAPLNHIREPQAGFSGSERGDDWYLELVTVAPQDDPQIKLGAIYDADGTLYARAAFDDPTDGSWKTLFRGDLSDYDAEADARTRNEIVYITEGLVRAEVLRTETVLTARESQVQALAEAGYDAERIAEILALDRETVDTTDARIEQRIERAKQTVDLLDQDKTSSVT